MGWTVVMRRLALVAAFAGGLATGQAALAQSTTPTSPAPTAPVTPPPVVPGAPATPAQPSPAPSAATPTQAPPPPAPAAQTTPPAPAPAAPAATPAAPDAGSAGPDQTVPDTSISQIIDLQPHPVIMLSGTATWDEGFKTLNDAFDKLAASLAKLNIKMTGHPMAVFKDSNDSGFKYDAMIPVEKAPDAKPDLAADMSFAMSPGGKVMKFQHRAAYDDIDPTYEAITAYLDEKGIDTRNNVYAEEFLNRTKTSDDASLEVDILVFLKQ